MAEAQGDAQEVETKVNLNYEGPKQGVCYPLQVVYCGECGLPIDLCEYSPNLEACKEWLNKNHPSVVASMNALKLENKQDANNEDTDEKKSTHQKRGGKGQPKAKKEKPPTKIIITKEKRKGNKFVTIITGLAGNDVDLDAAKKFFAQKFSCGCSKGTNDDLTIQGDFVDMLVEILPEKYTQITEDMIEEKESK